jgi:integral membrane protein (TIGR01906 family)
MKESRSVTVLFALLAAVLVISGSVAVPLLFRPFYYAHIELFDLTRYGVTVEQIKTAYNQMMDFCIGLRPDFAVGELIFSQSGMEHFVDVRKLFLLDLWALGLSTVAVVLLALVCRKKKVRPALLAGHGAGFWGAVGLAAVFLVVGGLAALDFDRAFVIFHALFFPGKSNWTFDWRTDPIILLLPQDFFMNCAILILALVLVWCAALIAADLWARKRRRVLEERARKAAEIQAVLDAVPFDCRSCPSFKENGGCSGCGPKT